MATHALVTDWLDEYTGPQFVWYVKRLAGNDTLANGSHQAGPYIPKKVLFDVLPALNRPEEENPDIWFDLYIDSHSDARKVRAVWYNKKLHGGTRNETRLTNFGGANSALLDPESTGALTVFAFDRGEEDTIASCHVWVCRHATEEDLVESRIGPVEPGRWRLWTNDDQGLASAAPASQGTCWLQSDAIPDEWLASFPTGTEIIHLAVEQRPAHGVPVDLRLIYRRKCEFEIFQSIESAIELPWIQEGFITIDEFIARAQTVLQRRKSRSGRSLELHTHRIFIEEGLVEGRDFAYQAGTDAGRGTDFLFPSQEAYQDPDFPSGRLRMLAAKTTCKDRWRQILNEADRIPEKHLLTLQEGVSENQFKEMVEAGVRLVVPAPLVQKYPDSVQPHLQTLESFIADVRLLSLD